MTTDRHAQIKQVFLEVCARPPEERAAYLNGVCPDADLRREVEKLLAHHTDDDPVERRPSAAKFESITVPVRRSTAREPDEPDGDPRFAAGRMIGGRFRIVDRVGAGGMGEVWRAEDTVVGQTVALKFLPRDVSGDARWLSRLRREVRVARTVTHPNVCRVHDIGEADGEYFLAMEFVDGENLATLLRQAGRFSPARALETARQICFGLAAAHAKGVLHRDLKPANILIDKSGNVQLTDFGLAAPRDAIPRLEIRAGTPAYMAPEQYAGIDVSVRSDIYALGLVLYELFTGEAAFGASNPAGYAGLHSDAAPTPPSELATDLDPAVERIILQCIQKDPEDRPASALLVAAALPGGDVLGALVATGETPPPEMIAAAGGSGSWARSVSLGLLLATGLLAATYVIHATRSNTRLHHALAKPPEVLADAARKTLADLGIDRAGMSEAFGFADAVSTRFWEDPVKVLGNSSFASYAFATAAPDDPVFWYRIGPPPMYPTDPIALTLRTERATAIDPPITTRGMTSLVYTSDGALRGFVRVPPAEPSSRESRPLEQALLERISSSAPALTPTDPDLLPTVPFTARRAWLASHTDSDDEAQRFETATLGATPVFAAAVTAHSPEASEPLYRRSSWRRAAHENIQIVLFLPTFLIGVPIAFSHLRRGRGDIRGGFRLAGLALFIRGAVWLLRSPHTTIVGAELRSLLYAVIGMLAVATAMWVFYVALEPYVRRYWPQTIIAWSRLLMGRWRDPRVGRDVLVGAALGTFWAVVSAIDRSAAAWLGLDPRHALQDLDAFNILLGGRFTLAVVLQTFQRSLYHALLFLLIMVLLKRLLRRTWLAGVLATILIGLEFMPLGSHPAVSWLTLGLGVVGVGVWALTQFGIVPIVVGGLVGTLLIQAPVTLDPTRWYADIGLFCLAIVAAIAIFGFVTAGRPPLRPVRAQTA